MSNSSANAITNAVVFPGQGSQYVGMTKDLCQNFAVAKEVFDEVDESLQFSLSKIVFDGTEDELKLTYNAQPALMAASVAIFKVLEQETGKRVQDMFSYAAGHSLGEYTALCVCESINVSTCARILYKRGRAMNSAVELSGGGGMLALIGATEDQAKDVVDKVLKAGAIIDIANDNAIGQIILSGEARAIEIAQEVSSSAGVKKVIPLAVSGPFHSRLMKSAQEEMRKVLDDTELVVPKLPIIQNVSVLPTTDTSTIKEMLIEQIVKPVRWRETMVQMQKLGVAKVVEVGPKKVLTNLVSRCVQGLDAISIETIEDVHNYK